MGKTKGDRKGVIEGVLGIGGKGGIVQCYNIQH